MVLRQDFASRVRASAVAMFDETGELQQLTLFRTSWSFTVEQPLFSAEGLAVHN